jgi:hypothetical protein
MDSQRWVRAAGAAGGLALFAAILGWFLWMNLRTPPLAQRGETVGPVEPVPTAPQDRARSAREGSGPSKPLRDSESGCASTPASPDASGGSSPSGSAISPGVPRHVSL